jgi:Xaa-Pro aminopeptidase
MLFDILKIINFRRNSMKIYTRIIFILIFLFSFYATAVTQEYQSFFPPEEFKARRAKVFKALGSNAIAILQGAAEAGGYIYPRQSNSFYYLCGVENPYSYLILDGRSQKTTLYLQNKRDRGWERVLTLADKEKAMRLTGVDDIRSTNDMNDFDAKVIYTPFSPAEGYAQSRDTLRGTQRRIDADQWNNRISREENFRKILKQRCPNAEIKDLSPILDELRSIKSKREIELLRRAGELSAQGIIEAMRSSEPGVYEYQLEAPAKYIYTLNGCRFDGYQSITAAGVKSIGDVHYFFKSKQLKAGDLVLMDYSPDYHYYVSDIGRMWPADGKFQPWQRELCQFILDYHKEIIKRIKPGKRVREIMDEAKIAMAGKLNPKNFSKEIYAKACAQLVERGGGVFSHPVGMAVHDVGRYYRAPLKSGQVFAVDPQLRVPEENLYMRIEDTVVVTETGVEIFTKSAPWELDEIEKLVLQKGMLQKYPPIYESFPKK